MEVRNRFKGLNLIDRVPDELWMEVCETGDRDQDHPHGNIPRHILIKLAKIKHREQILKAAREKQQITHTGIPIRVTADLSIETLQARRQWQNILKVMKDNNLQPRLLYPARISFKYEGEIKSFTDKQKLREFSTAKPAVQLMLKDLL